MLYQHRYAYKGTSKQFVLTKKLWERAYEFLSILEHYRALFVQGDSEGRVGRGGKGVQGYLVPGIGSLIPKRFQGFSITGEEHNNPGFGAHDREGMADNGIGNCLDSPRGTESINEGLQPQKIVQWLQRVGGGVSMPSGCLQSILRIFHYAHESTNKSQVT
jgi:hypothetical protein